MKLEEAQRILTPRLWTLRIILSHQIPSCCSCGRSRAHLWELLAYSVLWALRSSITALRPLEDTILEEAVRALDTNVYMGPFFHLQAKKVVCCVYTCRYGASWGMLRVWWAGVMGRELHRAGSSTRGGLAGDPGSRWEATLKNSNWILWVPGF